VQALTTDYAGGRCSDLDAAEKHRVR
jgi:hypothetical protein